MPKPNVTLSQKLDGHKDCVYSLTIDRSEQRLFSGGGDGWLVEWDLRKGNKGKLLATMPSSIYSLCFVDDQQIVVTGLSSGGYHILDLESRKPVASFSRNRGIFDIVKHPEQDQLVVAGQEGYLYVTDLVGMKEVHAFRAGMGNARVIKFSPEKNELAVGFSDRYIRLFDAATFKLIDEFMAHDKAVFSLAYTPDGEHLISGGMDAAINIWERHHEHRLKLKIPAHMFTVNSLAVNEKRRWLASGSRDNTIRIWDLHSFELLKVIDRQKLDGHRHSVNALLWADEEGLLASASDDKMLGVWHLDDALQK